MCSTQWTPSWLALCASQGGAGARRRWRRGPARRSAPWPSVTMWVRSIFTPSASRPMSSTLPTMPTADDGDLGLQGLGLAAGLDLDARRRSWTLVELLDLGADAELHAALLEGLLRGLGDLLVLDRQDAVQRPRPPSRPRPRRAVEAGELDADGAGADDDQRLRRRLRGPWPRGRSRRARRRARGRWRGWRGPGRRWPGSRTWPRRCASRRPSARRRPWAPARPSPAWPCPRSPRSCSSSSGRRRPDSAAWPPRASAATTAAKSKPTLLDRQAVVLQVRQAARTSRRTSAAPWSGCSPSSGRCRPGSRARRWRSSGPAGWRGSRRRSRPGPNRSR